jgi:alginate O-acetyltransferase complex protein AlgI
VKFNSLVFFALLLPTLATYWAFQRQQLRLWLVLVVSLAFYGYAHWPSVFLLIFTIGFNYAMGLRQARYRSRALLAGIVGVNLSLLMWFKYAAFAGENLQWLFALAGLYVIVPKLPTYLPLGISFFTFQVVAYQVDIYRKEIEAERLFVRFAVFKCFFPQLIAGPIVRAREFLPQLRKLMPFDAGRFHRGLWLLTAGLALKIGVADVLVQFANEAFADPAALSTSGAWTGLYAYAFQIYADFWGYSTMAVGIALLFGLDLPLNFESPYVSASIREFWRRWHITLSVWFRDYVYIPLGGNRKRHNLNLLLTMALAGLWHGAGWNFLIWGSCHGLWLVVERSLPVIPHLERSRVAKIVKTFLVFNGVCLLWVLFRSPNLSIAGEYYSRLLLPPFSGTEVPSLLSNWLILFAVIQFPLAWTFADRRFAGFSLPTQWALSLVAALFILAYAGAQVNFIYFIF